MTFVRILGLATLVGTLAIAAQAEAQTFDQTHPRRAEVNGRLSNQNARISNGVKDGQLTHGEAKAMARRRPRHPRRGARRRRRQRRPHHPRRAGHPQPAGERQQPRDL